MATFGVMRVRFCVTQSLICMPSASSVASPVWFTKTATTTFSGSRPLVVAAGLLVIRGQSQTTAIAASTMTASAARPPNTLGDGLRPCAAVLGVRRDRNG